MNWKIPAALTGGAIALTSVFATAAVAQTSPAHPATTTAAHTIAKHTSTQSAKPTIVLVPGAFEDSSAWNGEVSDLQAAGYPVVVVAVPLRSVASDSAYLTALVEGIGGPVVLVGHSYAGFLITETAAQDPAQVKALVYTAAFIPQAGETTNQLDTQFPGSLLGPDTSFSVTIPGGTDIYVKPSSFQALFAGDRTPSQAAVAAATQRPITAAALNEPAAASLPAGIPVYAIVASHDMAIPPAAEQSEAERAGAVITTVNSAHDLPASHPGAVTAVIERAAR